MNLRLRPGRIVTPDLVVTADIDLDALVVDAAAVPLVCEVVSPSSESIDRVLKAHYYAAAGIPWYMAVSQDRGTMHLLGRPVGDTYSENAVTGSGEVLRLAEPFRAVIDSAEWLRPG